MKKLKSLLAALLAVTMALTATACGNTDGQQEGGVSTSIDPSTVLEENSDVIHAFGGGSSGGGYYTISNVLSQYFTDNGFGNFIAQPTTGRVPEWPADAGWRTGPRCDQRRPTVWRPTPEALRAFRNPMTACGRLPSCTPDACRCWSRMMTASTV